MLRLVAVSGRHSLNSRDQSHLFQPARHPVRKPRLLQS